MYASYNKVDKVNVNLFPTSIFKRVSSQYIDALDAIAIFKFRFLRFLHDVY